MRAEFTNATIVLLGKFNPNACVPEALADAKVISRKEASTAKLKVLAPNAVTQFSLSWGEVLITKERVQVGTTEAPYIRICDFVLKSMLETDGASQVSGFGVNLECHFKLANNAARDSLGKRLAPPDAWGAWGKCLAESMRGPDDQHGGMYLLQMRQPFAEEKVSGWLDISVGPSQRVDTKSGVYFRTNHHHQAPKDSGVGKSQVRVVIDGDLSLLDILGERFDSSIQTAEKIFQEVLRR